MEIRAYTEEEVYPVVSEGEAERPAWLDEGLGKTGWANLPLKQELLFDVVKRVAQLTGRRLPDPEVSKMKTVVDLREISLFFSLCGGVMSGWLIFVQWSISSLSLSLRNFMNGLQSLSCRISPM